MVGDPFTIGEIKVAFPNPKVGGWKGAVLPRGNSHAIVPFERPLSRRNEEAIERQKLKRAIPMPEMFLHRN
jgi:hypothetical protein